MVTFKIDRSLLINKGDACMKEGRIFHLHDGAIPAYKEKDYG
ncbi:MAG: hypothetical protein PHQ90_00555 [Sulfuricurvum sp.]|nr:hypothetical protein [Sulfuricurvum sp.]MDD2367756.1 hypothetical protein [Sulfuricurvum sp.]MDD5117330.1 hypothetical protein [Sulfuricurvum sp.]